MFLKTKMLQKLLGKRVNSQLTSCFIKPEIANMLGCSNSTVNFSKTVNNIAFFPQKYYT